MPTRPATPNRKAGRDKHAAKSARKAAPPPSRHDEPAAQGAVLAFLEAASERDDPVRLAVLREVLQHGVQVRELQALAVSELLLLREFVDDPVRRLEANEFIAASRQRLKILDTLARLAKVGADDDPDDVPAAMVTRVSAAPDESSAGDAIEVE